MNGFGHPRLLVSRIVALILPFAAVFRDERPEVTKSRRGEEEARSNGMKVVVTTCVLVTLTE